MRHQRRLPIGAALRSGRVHPGLQHAGRLHGRAHMLAPRALRTGGHARHRAPARDPASGRLLGRAVVGGAHGAGLDGSDQPQEHDDGRGPLSRRAQRAASFHRPGSRQLQRWADHVDAQGRYPGLAGPGRGRERQDLHDAWQRGREHADPRRTDRVVRRVVALRRQQRPARRCPHRR